MNKHRFYISTQGNDDEAYREAIKHACLLAKEDEAITRIVLLIGTKNNTGWFERLYGRESVKKLFLGAVFKNCRVPCKFETRITFKDNYGNSDVVITCGMDSDDVLKVDDYDSVKAIIAIPWLPNGLAKWTQTWNPVEIRGNQEKVVAYPEPSCIVQKAMDELTESINISTGIRHPSDERQAKTYILALHKYEPSLDADIVGSYLVRKLNWETEDAKEVEKLIATLNEGKFFQGGVRTGLQDQYKRWKNQCD